MHNHLNKRITTYLETPKRVSVVIVSSHPPYGKGGVESYNRHIMLLSRKLCLDLKLLTYIPSKFRSFLASKDKVLWIGVPSTVLYRIMISHNFVGRLNTLLKKVIFVLLHWLFIIKGMFELLPKLSKCHIIISNGAFVEAIPTLLFSILLRKNFFVIWHTSLVDFVKNPIVRTLLKIVFSNACGVLVNGMDIAKYAKYLGARRVYIRVQDVDIWTFKPLNIYEIRDKLGIPPNAVVVLFASPLNEVKMADIFIKAAETILQKDRTFMFIIIGEGPLATDAETLKKQYPNNVVFINGLVPSEKLNEFLNACDIFFGHADTYYPARITLEALSAGRPVVLLDAAVGDRRKRLRFRILLPNIFIVNPTGKDLAEFLLKYKNRILALSRDSKVIIESRNYVVRKHAYEKQLLRDIGIVLRSCLAKNGVLHE